MAPNKLPAATLSFVLCSVGVCVDKPTSLELAAQNFEWAANAAKNLNQMMTTELEEIKAIHVQIAEQKAAIEKLNRDMQAEQSKPLPPNPSSSPSDSGGGGGSGMGSGLGGGPGGGGGGSSSGGSGGLQAPKMASLPESPAFSPAASPKEVSPNLSMEFGSANGDGARRFFNPGNSSIPPFTPPKLDFGSPALNTSPQFGPAEIAAKGLPKLKTLEPMGPAGGADKSSAPTPAGPQGSGGTGFMGTPMGGGGSNAAADGGDGAMRGVGAEPPYDAASGISTRDAGWGSGNGGGSESDSGDETGSDGGDKPSPQSRELASRPTAAGKATKFGRTKKDGTPDDTIFGIASNRVADWCGFAPDSGFTTRSPLCDKALANEVRLATADTFQQPTGDKENKDKEQQKEKPALRRLPNLPSGLREIASEQAQTTSPEAATANLGSEPGATGAASPTALSPTVPATRASGQGPEDALLGVVRAGAGTL